MNKLKLIKIYCYIMIIPAFGIISHAISAFSGKQVFGLSGPLKLLMQQTICKKV